MIEFLFIAIALLLVFFNYLAGRCVGLEYAVNHVVHKLVEEGLLQIKHENGEEVIYSGYKHPK